MAWYVVSYDLRRELTSDDYRALHDLLRTATDWCWPLESFWIIETSRTPTEVISILLNGGVLDDNDGVVVLEITGAGAYRRVASQGVADWLDRRLRIT